MNIVFLSPQFPPQFYLFCVRARARGLTVLGVGDGPFHDLRAELKAALNEYVFVPDMWRYEDVLRAVGYLTWKHGRIDRIESLNEHWLDVEAQLRDDFNIVGPRSADMKRNRSKSGMKEVFRAAKIPVADGEKLTGPQELRKFVEAHGYPVVVKPDTGVGAMGTFKIANERELIRAMEKPLEGGFVETFIDGKLVSYDGLTNSIGEVVVATSLSYNAGVMELLNEQRDVYYHTVRDIPAPLVELGERAVRAFNLRERFFHIEFFVRPDGSLRALEANFRPPGGFTTDMMNYCCDIDLYDLWARAISGKLASTIPYERLWCVGHISRRKQHRYALRHGELVKKMGEALVYFREVPSIFAPAMGDVVYVARAKTEAELDELARLAHEAGPHAPS